MSLTFAAVLSRSHVVRYFSRSILADAVQAGLNVASSVLLVRALGAEVTGYYYLLAAFFGFFPAILNSLDQSLTRFLPLTEDSERTKLTVAVFVAKFYGALGGLGIVAVLWTVRFVPAGIVEFVHDYSPLLVVAAAANGFLLPLAISWSGRTISGHQDYGFEIGSNLLLALATTGWLVVVIGFPELQRIDTVLIGAAGITFVAGVVKLWRVSWLDRRAVIGIPKYLARPAEAFSLLTQKQYRQYFGPFFVSSLSGYLKDLFPLLVVGSLGSPSTVTAFRVIQQIFRSANKFVPNAFEIIRPSLVSINSAAGEQSRFVARYQGYALAYLSLVALFSLCCVYGLGPILSIWTIEATPTLYLVATIFALEVLILSASHVEYQIFLLQSSTSYVAWVSLSRQMVTIVVIFIAGARWGLTGVALGMLAGAVLTWVSFFGYALRHLTRPSNRVWRAAAVLLALALLVIVASVPLWTSA
jgi:O-antigen/teichoic acid export membrane protein